MTKKDFIALADALRGKAMPREALDALLAFCQRSNPNFKRDRWLDYYSGLAGPNGGKSKA